MTISELERVGRKAGVYFTAADLMEAEFPEPRWAVPGLVAEGLNILVGAPKLGKSWLCLGLAVAVASGGRALGKIEVEQGPVLYAALEDPPRRLQNRLAMVLGNSPVPIDLHMVTNLPRLPILVEYLAGWLDDHLDTRLVIVDVLRKVRPLSDGKGNAYNEDYDTLSALKDLADRYKIAVIVVHHTRKMTDDADVFNEVSGSTGLTGAADAILIAKRARNTADAVLHLTGRDVSEHEYGMTWDAEHCMWTLLDEPVALATMGNTRRTIVDFLADHEGSTPQEIALGTGLKLNTVQVNVRRMVADDQLDSDGEGRYLPRIVSVSPVSPVSRQSLKGTPPDSGLTVRGSHNPMSDGTTDTADTADTDFLTLVPAVSRESQDAVVNRLLGMVESKWTQEGARSAVALAYRRSRKKYHDPSAMYFKISQHPEKFGGPA